MCVRTVSSFLVQDENFKIIFKKYRLYAWEDGDVEGIHCWPTETKQIHGQILHAGIH